MTIIYVLIAVSMVAFFMGLTIRGLLDRHKGKTEKYVYTHVPPPSQQDIPTSDLEADDAPVWDISDEDIIIDTGNGEETKEPEEDLSQYIPLIREGEPVLDYLERLDPESRKLVSKRYIREKEIGLKPEKYEEPTVTFEDVREKEYVLRKEDTCRFTMTDDTGMPQSVRLPMELFHLLARHFDLVYDGYVYFDKPVLRSDVDKLLAVYDIKMAYVPEMRVFNKKPVNEYNFMSTGNQTGVSKALDLDNDLIITENVNHEEAMRYTKTNSYPIKYEKGGELVTKYTKQVEVYNHYVKKFPFGWLPTEEEFVDWYDRVSEDILKLYDEDPKFEFYKEPDKLKRLDEEEAFEILNKSFNK